MAEDAAPAAAADAASEGPVREFPAGRVRNRLIRETDEEVYGEQCRGAAAGVGGRWAGRARESRGDLFCTVAGASRTRLRGVLDLTVERGTERSCRAAALALRASWTGLWWPETEQSAVCALAPRGRRVEDPTFHVYNGELCYDDEDEGYCVEFPAPLRTAGAAALHDRPTSSALVIAEIAPGENVHAVGFLGISYYAHRGIVRRAGGRLRVGDTVFPTAPNERDAYPFHDWDDPGDDSYQVVGNGPYEDVRFNSPDAPLIEWEQLRPQQHFEGWLRLERADGTRGWALDRPCAFLPDYENNCVDGARVVQPETAPASNTAHPRLLYTLRADIIIGAAFSADGSRVITSSVERAYATNGVERAWDASSGLPVALAPQTDNRSVTVEDGAANVRTADGRVVVSVHDDASRVNTARLVGNGTRIATLSDNYTASLWDTATGRRLFMFGGRFDRLGGVMYSPDGARIVTWGGADPPSAAEEPTRIWDAANGRLLHALPTFGAVSTFSLDARQFAMKEWDIVTIFDTHTGQATRTLGIESRHEPVHSVVFSPDGTRLLTGDPWNTASLWDIATGEVVLRLRPFDPTIPGVRPGPLGVVTDASFSPNGTRILTVGRGVAQVWDLTNVASVDR
jgi:WD40 repeat protein